MANATVENVKDLGLRHGEKVVVCLTAALCLVFAWSAFSRPTIALTPEQMKKAAESAESNIRRHQDPEEILKTLVDQGMKNPGFEKIVDRQAKDPLAPDP